MEVDADATDKVTVEEKIRGGVWCCRRRTAMAADEEACGTLPAAVEEEGSGSHLSCFRNIYFIVSLRRYVVSKLIYIQYVNLRTYNKFRCMYRDHL